MRLPSSRLASTSARTASSLRRVRKKRPSTGALLAIAVAFAASIAACGSSAKKESIGFNSSESSGSGSTSSAGLGGASTGSGTASGMGGGDGGFVLTGSGGSCATPGLTILPGAEQTVQVTVGQTSPTVAYQAVVDCAPVTAAWTVDKGNVGTVPTTPASQIAFTPTGQAGGLVTLTAGYNGKTATAQLMVQLSATQNGPNTSSDEASQIPTDPSMLTAGGGVGGVGGEGLGTPVTDPPTLTALGAPTSAGGLALTYPYDKTVWPRGLLAPLLQWSSTAGDADAVQIQLSTTTKSFSYTGTFGRPAILGTNPFIRMPIPQDIWAIATNTASGSGDQLTVSLTIAKGGVGYGPVSETWTIAPVHLSGTIYYQSYGTQLAQNYGGAVGGNGLFGGAVLSIRVGDTGPKLVAGTNSTPPDESGCRVCHSVAAGGTRLIVQHGENYGESSAYDLGSSPATEHVMTNDATFPAVYPDGSMALLENGTLIPLPADATPIATTGLSGVVSDLGRPAFSPDGKMIAFNPLAGAAPLKTYQTLYAMAFDQPSSTFSGLTLIADATSQPNVYLGWPAFFPDSKSVVFHRQTQNSSCDGTAALVTRSGSLAQIYWTDLANPSDVTPLDQLNGVGYLPKLPAPSPVACSDACGTASSPTTGSINGDHSDDVDVNYEPTVAPIASGGYAWVVFTSRRMYGNVATIGSFCSDPRGVDLVENITPKKLWVAAIDLTQSAGVDRSHPAFYLPAQELLAGNARAFWTLDPCHADGTSCETGDECCNGYCEPAGDGGALVCSNAPPNNMCSGVGDKCASPTDCCDTTNLCVDGFCTQSTPQ